MRTSIIIPVNNELIRIIPERIFSVVRKIHSSSSRVNSSVDHADSIRTRTFPIDLYFRVVGDRECFRGVAYRIANFDWQERIDDFQFDRVLSNDYR